MRKTTIFFKSLEILRKETI